MSKRVAGRLHIDKRLPRYLVQSATVATVIGSCLFVGQGHAQDKNAASPSSTHQATALEEIIVTARRRAENIQDVPVSVSVISGDDLKRGNIQNIADLQTQAPTLTISTFAEDTTISIRGQGGFDPGSSPAVVGYFNEVPLPSTAGSNGGAFLNGSFYDLENVQVLNGPQGTLFGRNTTGGAVLFQTKRPTDRFESYAELTGGNYDNRELELMINAPLIGNQLLARLVGRTQNRDGYTRTQGTPGHPGGLDLDDRDNEAVRLSLTFVPNDNLQNDLILDYYESSTNNASSLLGYIAPWMEYIYPGLPELLAQQKALGPRKQLPISVDQFNHSRQWSVANISRYDISDNLSVRNIFGYYNTRTSNAMDGDGTDIAIFDYPATYPVPTEREQYTEELQLQGQSGDGLVTWVAGGFLLHEPTPSLDKYTYEVYGGTPYGSVSTTQLAVADDSKALYAQFSYDLSGLGLPGFDFTAGYRYTWDERFSMVYRNQPFCVQDNKNPECFVKFEAPTWTLALDYEISSNAMVYGTVRRGFRSGGLNSESSPSFPVEFDPEYVTDQELGIKTHWNIAGMDGMSNLAVYHQDYQDIHVSTTVVNPDGTVPILTLSGADASVWGAEFDWSVMPIDGVELSGGIAWIELDKFKNFSPLLDPEDIELIEGKKRSQRPEWKYNAAARYYLPLDPSVGETSVYVNWAWQSRSGTENPAYLGPDPLKMRDSYGWLNLGASWKHIFDSPFDAEIYVTNALDDEVAYGQMTVADSVGTSTRHYLEPRMYGLRVRYNLGGE